MSGNQSLDDAAIHLNLINRECAFKPWPLTFSYGRVLQASVLSTWGGKKKNVAAAQAELLRVVMVSNLIMKK